MTAAYGDGWQWLAMDGLREGYFTKYLGYFNFVAEFSIRRAHSYDTPVQFSALSKTACGNILKPPPRSM